MLAVIETEDGAVMSIHTYREDGPGLRLAVERMQSLIVEDIVDDTPNVPREKAQEYASKYHLGNTEDRVRGNLVYRQGEYFGAPIDASYYSVTLVPSTTDGHNIRKTIQFKVASISSNTGDFGHTGHILVSRDGLALEGGRIRGSGNVDLKKGDILEFICNAEGIPVNPYAHAFECLDRFRDGKAPEGVVEEVWAMEGELIPR